MIVLFIYRIYTFSNRFDDLSTSHACPFFCAYFLLFFFFWHPAQTDTNRPIQTEIEGEKDGAAGYNSFDLEYLVDGDGGDQLVAIDQRANGC